MNKEIKQGTNAEKEFFVSEKISPGSNGWLSPSGKYFECQPDEHDEAAAYLCDDDHEYIFENRGTTHIEGITSGYIRRNMSSEVPRLELEAHDWLLINKSYLSNFPSKITNAQLKMLEESGIPFMVSITQETLDLSEFKEIGDRLRKTVEEYKDVHLGEVEKIVEKEKPRFEEYFYDRSALLDKSKIGRCDGLVIGVRLFNEAVIRNGRSSAKLFRFMQDCGWLGSINEYLNDPFNGNISLDYYVHNSREGEMMELYNKLSKQSVESIRIFNEPGTLKRETELRMVETKIPGTYLVVDLGLYTHVGDAQRYGEEYRNVSISTRLQSTEEILNFVKGVADIFPGISIQFGKDNQVFTATDLLG